MNPKFKWITLSLIFVITLAFVPQFSQAEDDLNLEAQQHWETYQTGGTCIPGTHNLYTADIDNDGIIEIITGGYMYYMENGSKTSNEAPLRIWNWNGENLTLEKRHNWNGSIGCVYASDLDGDGIVEVITYGPARNETGNLVSSIRIWHWDNQELTLVTHYDGVAVSSISVADLENDGKMEMMTVGSYRVGSNYTARLCLWHYENANLTLTKQQVMNSANVRNANSVYAANLDGSGNLEIATGGYSGSLNNSKGQLCVWQWDGTELSLAANEQWQILEGYGETISGSVQGNTVVNNVKAGDVDGDGVVEVVTGGFCWDGQNVTAQLRIWSFGQDQLTLEVNRQWADNYLNEVKCISLQDVDADSKIDVVTSGVTCSKGSFSKNSTASEAAQLHVWDWNGNALTLKHHVDWVTDEGVCAWNVAVADLNNNGQKEIICVGCSYIAALCDPDMRIWTLNLPNMFPTLYLTVLVGAIVAVAIVVLAIFRLKRGAIKN